MRRRAVGDLVGVAGRVLLLVLLAAAISRSVILAWADIEYRQSTLAGIHRAEQLVPSNGLYHYINALLLEQREPTSPAIEREFAAAVADNPRYSDALLAWSVDKELRGDKSGAEKLLLDARQLDHLLRPAWALANFYFRQSDAPRFLAQARESLDIIGKTGFSEGRFDAGPIYDLCWRSGASSSAILAQAIPNDRAVEDSYFGYLVAAKRLPAAIEVADRLLPGVQQGELLFFTPYVNQLIYASDWDNAAKAWKAFYRNRVVPYPGPDKTTGVYLTNGDFSGAPLNFGFDWHRISPESVQFTASKADHSYRFDFEQAVTEPIQLLFQSVMLTGGRKFVFTVNFKSDFDPEQSGLRWSVTDHKTNQVLPIKVSQTSPGETRTLSLEFETPSGTNGGDLHLGYQRQPGTAPVRGFYELLHADLRAR